MKRPKNSYLSMPLWQRLLVLVYVIGVLIPYMVFYHNGPDDPGCY